MMMMMKTINMKAFGIKPFLCTFVTTGSAGHFVVVSLVTVFVWFSPIPF